MNQEVNPRQILNLLVPRFGVPQPPGSMRKKFLFVKPPSLWYLYYSSPNRIRQVLYNKYLLSHMHINAQAFLCLSLKPVVQLDAAVRHSSGTTRCEKDHFRSYIPPSLGFLFRYVKRPHET